jgi:hypothetical protein
MHAGCAARLRGSSLLARAGLIAILGSCRAAAAAAAAAVPAPRAGAALRIHGLLPPPALLCLRALLSTVLSTTSSPSRPSRPHARLAHDPAHAHDPHESPCTTPPPSAALACLHSAASTQPAAHTAPPPSRRTFCCDVVSLAPRHQRNSSLTLHSCCFCHPSGVTTACSVSAPACAACQA